MNKSALHIFAMVMMLSAHATAFPGDRADTVEAEKISFVPYRIAF